MMISLTFDYDIGKMINLVNFSTENYLLELSFRVSIKSHFLLKSQSHILTKSLNIEFHTQIIRV